jgi:hypothetical protein
MFTTNCSNSSTCLAYFIFSNTDFPPNLEHTLFTASSVALAAALPIGLVVPASAGMFCDAVLVGAIPLHMFYGSGMVLDDYVKKPSLKFLMALISGMVAVGLWNITFKGSGITASLKSLWTSPKPVSA